MNKLTLSAIGVILWLAAQALALMLGAAGHGWGTPFLVSIPLIVLYPAILIRASVLYIKGSAIDAGILFVAILLDAYLVMETVLEDGSYFLRIWKASPAVVIGWVDLWLGWQVVIAVSMIRSRLRSAL